MYQHDTFLTDVLANTAQGWVQGFRSEYGLDADRAPEGVDVKSWELAKALDQLAARIVSASRTLDPAFGNPGQVLDQLRQQYGLDLIKNEVFVQAIEIHLVEELEDELDRMRRRALELVRHLVSVTSERARAYLARVGACYSRGMATETVVMSGAVLDAALQEAVADEDVRAAGVRCGKYVSMGNRIEYMRSTGRWNEAVTATAFRLAHARNNAIHTTPDLERDVEAVIGELVVCLNALAQPSSGHGV